MTLTKIKIEPILTNFGLSKLSGSIVLGGLANQNILVKTIESKVYVVKILGLQKKELLENDLFIQQQLQQTGINTPIYLLDKNNDYLYEGQNIQAVVSNKINGIHSLKLNFSFCFEIGKALAIFHKSIINLPIENIGWLNFKSAKESLLLKSDLDYILSAKKLINENTFIYNKNLPSGIVHGDLHEENVLIDSEENPIITCVMDFEESERNLLIVDLARTILSVCRDKNGTKLLNNKVNSVVDGYESIRTLANTEKELLINAIKYVIGVEVIWLHIHGFTKEAAEHIQRSESTILQ